MLSRDDYRKYINADAPLVNVAPVVRIERAVAGIAWRAVCVYHLPGEINNRMLIAFCDVLTGTGEWASMDGLRIAYTWEGRTGEPLYRPFEKRPPEPRAQIDLYKNQVTTAWVYDLRYSSDRVVGLRSDIEDGPGGNTRFHNSYIVLWQLGAVGTTTPPIDPPAKPRTLEAAWAEIDKLWAVVTQWNGGK